MNRLDLFFLVSILTLIFCPLSKTMAKEYPYRKIKYSCGSEEDTILEIEINQLSYDIEKIEYNNIRTISKQQMDFVENMIQNWEQIIQNIQLIQLYKFNMTENGTQVFIKDLYQIERVLMEAQKKVFEMRLELQNEIKDANSKGADSLTQVALTNTDLYRGAMVPSKPKSVPQKRIEIIDLEQTSPVRVPTIKQQIELNISRKNDNYQQETSVNESEINYLEKVNREMEDQNSEIEIEVDIPSQMKQLLKDEKNIKKKKKDIQHHCPVCSKILSSKRSVKRHLRAVHKMYGDFSNIRFDKLSLQYNHEIPVTNKFVQIYQLVKIYRGIYNIKYPFFQMYRQYLFQIYQNYVKRKIITLRKACSKFQHDMYLYNLLFYSLQFQQLIRMSTTTICECVNHSSLNGQVIKDLFIIEKMLIEAQEKVLQKRIEMTKYIRQNEELMLNNLPNQVFQQMLPNQFPLLQQETQKVMQMTMKKKRPSEVIDLESEEKPIQQRNCEIEVNFSNSEKKKQNDKTKNKQNKIEKTFVCHKCDKRLSTKGCLIRHSAVYHGELLNKNKKLEIIERI